jgi:hypothetical protein
VQAVVSDDVYFSSPRWHHALEAAVNLHKIKENFFRSRFFVAIKTEKDYYIRFRTSHIYFHSFLFRAVCFFVAWHDGFRFATVRKIGLLADPAMVNLPNCFCCVIQLIHSCG